MEGEAFAAWGAKQGSRVRSWKTRYFVLRGRELRYFSGAARDGSGVGEKGRVVVVGVEFAPELANGLLVRGAKRNQALRMTVREAADCRELFRRLKLALGQSQSSFRLSSASDSLSLGGSFSDRGSVAPQRKKSAPGFVPVRAVTSGAVGAVDVTTEGWLLKEEPELGTWKRRYVTLSGNVLTYYVSATSMALESDVVEHVARDFANPRALSVVAFGGRAVRLTAESRDEMDRWASAISKAIGKPPPTLLAAHSWEESDQAASARAQEQATCRIEDPSSSRRRQQYCEGWLEKRGHKSRSVWKKRYFLLADGMLEYRKNPTGEVCAENVVVDADYSDECHEWFVITFASDSPYDAYNVCVRAESSSERRRWMKTLCNLVGKPLPEAPSNNQRGNSVTNQAQAPAQRVEIASMPTPMMTDTRQGIVADITLHSEAKLRQSGHRIPAKPAPALVSSAGNQPLAIPDDQEVTSYRGWLLKKGHRFKRWKRRYFSLADTKLEYFSSRGMIGAPLGGGVVFDVTEGKGRPFALDIRFRHGRLLHVVAPNQEIFALWFHVLRVASELNNSFIQSHRGMQMTNDGEFFDNDADDAENDGGDAEFTEADIEEYQSQLGTGAALWVAAMKDIPQSSRKYSWESDAGAGEPDPATESEALVTSQTTQQLTSSLDPIRKSVETLDCSGWMLSEGGKLGSWKQRYFTLHKSKLNCYKNQSSPMILSLEVATVADSDRESFAMCISDGSGRDITLAAQSNQEYQKWWNALFASTHGKSKPAPLFRTPSEKGAERFSASSYDMESSTHSGWLEKEGRRFKTWKRRYFEYKNGALIYYNDVNGSVLGHGMVQHAYLAEDQPNTIVIEFRSRKTMRVYSSDSIIISGWLDALMKTRSASAGTASLSEASDIVIDLDEGRQSVPQENRRLDSSDYFANDTITDESYRRIRSFEDNASLVQTMNEAELSFKGELAFGKRVHTTEIDVEDACDEEEDPGDVMDTANGVDYYRELAEEEALAMERKMAADLARASELPPVQGCAPCCVVM